MVPPMSFSKSLWRTRFDIPLWPKFPRVLAICSSSPPPPSSLVFRRRIWTNTNKVQNVVSAAAAVDVNVVVVVPRRENLRTQTVL